LSRTIASNGTSTTWTYSTWVKRGTLGAAQDLFAVRNGTSNIEIIFLATNSFGFYVVNSGSFAGQLETTQVFRDPSAWYHIVVVCDTTNATAANRLRVYVNGIQVTAFSTATYPAQNTTTVMSQTAATHTISSYPTGSQYFDGYLAEVNFIDGQALTPSSFGAISSTTGVWQPIAYTGTYGTNGFYLPFPLNTTQTYGAQFSGSNYINASTYSFNWATGGNFTMETWVYPTAYSSSINMIGGTSHSQNDGYSMLYYYSTGKLAFGINGTNEFTSSTGVINLNTWYHIAVVNNGGTLTMYVNGTSVATAGTSYLSNNSASMYIGTSSSANQGVIGYMSNWRFVTSAVYTSNFIPPSAPLTAITNTQLLTFQNSTIQDNSGNSRTLVNNGSVTTSVVLPFSTVTNITADQSGNGNNWTPNNISLAAGVTYDSMTDVPTLTSATASNFTVINQLDKGANVTVANSNLQISQSVTGVAQSIRSSMGMAQNTLKFYWEVVNQGGNNSPGIVNSSALMSTFVGGDINGWSYFIDGTLYNNNASASYGATYTTGDIIGIAFDTTTGTLTFYKNGVSQGTAKTGLTGTWFPALSTSAVVTVTASINFGQQPFTYTPPTGYVALNAYNLPAPTVSQGNTVMDATLYTGTGARLNVVNAAPFYTDFVWIKCRSAAQDHNLYDSVRGVNNYLTSDTTAAAVAVTQGLLAFTPSGFTVGTGSDAAVNTLGQTYVAWQWQAGQGSTSSNTNGSITSTVSVNASAGFSVVTYTGTGANATVGHGLGVAPSFIVCKARGSQGTSSDWACYHVSLGATNRIWLNLTNATASNIVYWNNTAPTSSVFSLGTEGTVNTSGNTNVAYCWTPIAGYSAFGSYTGNGSTDGPFVYTGFRPKFVLTKSASGSESWYINDSARDTYNPDLKILAPNDSAAEFNNGSVWMDLTSNGFKIRYNGSPFNTSGATYIYAAFAENPFKYALAR
jgi:hypothetical protein